ncbi:MAG: peptidase [Spirochaetaceae bacterium]|nr:peptidase [Spirochaetaceae bacterium]
MNPVKRAIASVFGVLLIFSCASLPLVDDAQMNKMGTEAFEDIKSKEQIETSAYLNKYVKCVANSILQVTQDNTGVEQWEIVVFRNNAVNAFALPGGKIGVYTGLLQVAKNQHQLAAVIGHEVGHVIKQHGKARVQTAMVTEGLLSVVQGASENPMVAQALGLGAQYGVMLPFSRSHETEADEVGLKLMSMAGFDPQESVKLWQNMAAAGGNKPPELISTHPSDTTRIKDLQSNMADALALRQAAQSQGKSPSCQ